MPTIVTPPVKRDRAGPRSTNIDATTVAVVTSSGISANTCSFTARLPQRRRRGRECIDRVERLHGRAHRVDDRLRIQTEADEQR
jgi:hypothetical protein